MRLLAEKELSPLFLLIICHPLFSFAFLCVRPLSTGPKRKRLLLDMRGVANNGGCCFRRGGKARRVLSGVAASLCLLLVARAVDGVVIVKEPLISTGMMKTSLLQ
jgi:hypothetical protein